MRSEVDQGNELTVRAAVLSLQINIQVLKFNSTTATIMTLIYPGTLPIKNIGEGLGDSDPSGMDEPRPQTITIDHYVHQHGGVGHYNPIIPQDEETDILEEIDVPEMEDDDERSNSESSISPRDDAGTIPAGSFTVMDTEEPESLD